MSEPTSRSNRTALITGAARRIGKAIALALADDGWQVVIHHNASCEDAERLADEILAKGGEAKTIQCDLADPAAHSRLIAKCDKLDVRPTCLVNNASAFFEDLPRGLSAEVWDAHMNTNLRAPVFLASYLANQLPSDATGNIINIIDQRVLRPRPEFFSYTLSKSALLTATQTLAQTLAPRIRVNAIAPGPTLQSVHQSPEDFAAEVAATPLHRPCGLDEITAAVRLILACPSMTGQMITLDSGQHLL